MVDFLLRSGANETILDSDGKTAADIVGEGVYEMVRWDVERVRKLLANAPADRAWRRRGCLVLCRAHPDRLGQTPEMTRSAHPGIGRMTRSVATLARTEEAFGCSGTTEQRAVDGRSDGE